MKTKTISKLLAVALVAGPVLMLAPDANADRGRGDRGGRGGGGHGGGGHRDGRHDHDGDAGLAVILFSTFVWTALLFTTHESHHPHNELAIATEEVADFYQSGEIGPVLALYQENNPDRSVDEICDRVLELAEGTL